MLKGMLFNIVQYRILRFNLFTLISRILLSCVIGVYSNLSFGYVVVPPMQTPAMVFNFCPYIGFDGNIRHMDWPNHSGGNLFKKDYPEADLYIGAKFNPCFGIQAGYKVTSTRTRFPSLSASTVLGVFQPFFDEHISRAQFKGWHAEFVGYLPIYSPDCLYLFGTLGLTRFKLFQQDLVRVSNGLPLLPGVGDTTFSSTKTIVSASVGIEIKLDQITSLRVKAGYDNTAKFKNINATQTWRREVLGVKNSYTYGVGIVFNFF